ncbi:MAG TPA: cobyrinate a,c-diamide synthase [Candidatus Baltobacteraceae bacterium]|nr:cobyrinate a,c-diamide synthase [Candidatus Baltobacteraceae bacterium]
MKRALAIVAAGTGEGKTLVALALSRTLKDAGYTVAPFKSGPDYLDARLYEAACGVRARNADLWLDSRDAVRQAFSRAHSRGAAIVVEGMMGLFDGDDAGATSTAHLLSALQIPALLVVDGWRMSQSAAALAIGCASVEPRVELFGVVLNRCGGASHARAVAAACERVGIPLIATLPHRAQWSIPERHLGLDVRRLDEAARIAGEMAAELAPQLELQRWFGAPRPQQEEEVCAQGSGPVVAVAYDEALWFTYPETVEALQAAGARVVSFSPLRDRGLPTQTRGLWLGGGYPEEHAAELAANVAMRAAVAQAVASGMPVYAECGGLMFLGRELETRAGRFPMCGALDGTTSTAAPALKIGYRRTRAVRDSVLDCGDAQLRGYEFHYASGAFDEQPAYDGDGDTGVWRENVVASFLHRRFFAGKETTCRFVRHCERF